MRPKLRGHTSGTSDSWQRRRRSRRRSHASAAAALPAEGAASAKGHDDDDGRRGHEQPKAIPSFTFRSMELLNSLLKWSQLPKGSQTGSRPTLLCPSD